MLEGNITSPNATLEKWLHQTISDAISETLRNLKKDETALLDEKEAAEFLGLRPQTLSLWRHQSRGPAYHKLGSSIRYNLQDIKDFINNHRVGSIHKNTGNIRGRDEYKRI